MVNGKLLLNDRTALISGTYGYGKGYYGRNSYGYDYYGADEQKDTAAGKYWWRKLLRR